MARQRPRASILAWSLLAVWVAVTLVALALALRNRELGTADAVDRRFYRSRYDAGRTLDDFAGRLRHQLDIDAVATDLCAAAHDTMQPAHISLWLRP